MLEHLQWDLLDVARSAVILICIGVTCCMRETGPHCFLLPWCKGKLTAATVGCNELPRVGSDADV